MTERLNLEAVKARHEADESADLSDPAWMWAHFDRAALISEVEALREALKPFAVFGMAMEGSYKNHRDSDDFYLYNTTSITVGDFRRARAVLPETETEEK